MKRLPGKNLRWPGVGALVLIAVFLLAVARFWHPVYGFTAFLQLDSSNNELKITAFRELPIYVYRDTGGYDGFQYAQIAYHPLLGADELRLATDNLSYRARRILGPALAWLLAFGQPGAIVHVYSLLNVAAWLLLAWLLWRLLEVRDLRTWLGWTGVMFSAGALGSVRLALSDLLALTALAGAFWLEERSRRGPATALAGLAALTRETSLLAVGGLFTRPWFSFSNLRRATLAAIPITLWLAYVRWRAGPADQGFGNFTVPGAGLVEKWQAAFMDLQTIEQRTLGWGTVLATLGLTAQAVYLVVRPRIEDRWWRIGIAYASLMLFLGTAVWEGQPGAATRVLLPMSLAFSVLACRQRASLAWLVVGNATVFAGVLAIATPAKPARELAAYRLAGDVKAVVEVGTGFHGREYTRRHVWAWSHDASASLEITTWPRTDFAADCTLALRALVPQAARIWQGERLLWKGSVGTQLAEVNIPLQVENGRATLRLELDPGAVRRDVGADTRSLLVAVYDPRLQRAKP